MMMWLEQKWETTDEIIREMSPDLNIQDFFFILTDSSDTRLVSTKKKPT